MTKNANQVHSSISISKIRPWRHIRPLYRMNKEMVSRLFMPLYTSASKSLKLFSPLIRFISES